VGEIIAFDPAAAAPRRLAPFVVPVTDGLKATPAKSAVFFPDEMTEHFKEMLSLSYEEFSARTPYSMSDRYRKD